MAKKKVASSDEGLEKVTVRANDKVVAKGGAYHDPDHDANPKRIGSQPVEVVRSAFVAQRLKSGDLVEVRGRQSGEVR
jgi:hypothetical protein